MVAYSFKPRFIDPIDSGRKRQTIRAPGRRRHAKNGDDLQLYTGMRTRACRLIGRAICATAEPVEILFNLNELRAGNLVLRGWEQLDAFAQADGFTGWMEMREFWRAEHPVEFTAGRFEGVLISWTDYRSAR